MGLLEQWEKNASSFKDYGTQQRYWAAYYAWEKGVYEKLLTPPVEPVSGTVKELAEKYNTAPVNMAAFLDGINESIKEPNDTQNLEEDTEVKIEIELEKLYKNMVKAKADWLYDMPEWDALIDKERREELYKEQKRSTTIVKGKKIGRNDPCPCGSGKKYKQCCGR